MNSINRETIVINLDPAVKSPDAAIDICALGLVLCLVIVLSLNLDDPVEII